MGPMTRVGWTRDDEVDVNELVESPGIVRPPWRIVSAGSTVVRPEPPLRARQVYLQLVTVVVVILLAVGVLGAFASRAVAEQEAVHDASERADIIADAVIQPALRDGLLQQEPTALAVMDAAVRQHVLNAEIVRVKLWAANGTVVYSDEQELIGQTFTLSEDELETLSSSTTRAEVTDLEESENRFERGQGKLLEVYRAVLTPRGQTLLFEIYAPYSAVEAGTSRLWWGLAGISCASLLLLVLFMLPVLWRLLDRLTRAQEQREALLERTVEASAEERRRIAATLHDGVVQELVAASYVVAGAAARADAKDRDLAATLRAAAGTVRTGIGGLRSLLVDIYPPSLDDTGLVAAMGDLVASLRTRDIQVTLQVTAEEPTGLDTEGERQLFRVAQECLRNAARHSGSSQVRVSLATEQDEVVLDVIDGGAGLDPDVVLDRPELGHFGLRLMADAASRANGRLLVSSAPGAGTHWQLRVPRR